jgi:hypothetical protein
MTQSSNVLYGDKSLFKDHTDACIDTIYENDEVGGDGPSDSAPLRNVLDHLAFTTDLKGYGYMEYIQSIKKNLSQEESIVNQILAHCYYAPFAVPEDAGKSNDPRVALEHLKEGLESMTQLSAPDFVQRLMDLPSCLSEPCLRYIPFTSFNTTIGPVVAADLSSSSSRLSATSGDTQSFLEKLANVIKDARNGDANDEQIASPKTILEINYRAPRVTLTSPKVTFSQTNKDKILVIKAMLHLCIRLFYRVCTTKALHGTTDEYFYHDLPVLARDNVNNLPPPALSEQELLLHRRKDQALMPWYYVAQMELVIVISTAKKNKAFLEHGLEEFYDPTLIDLMKQYSPMEFGTMRNEMLKEESLLEKTISTMINPERMHIKTSRYLTETYGITKEKITELALILDRVIIKDRPDIFPNFSISDNHLVKMMFILIFYLGEPCFHVFVSKLTSFIVFSYE